MIPQPVQNGEVRRETNLAPPQSAWSRWRHAFGLFSVYWTSKDWKFAWAALLVLIAIQFGTSYAFLLSNRWQQAFYESLEQRQAARFAALIIPFGGIMALQIGITIVSNFLQMALSMRWRTFLTERYVFRWMRSNRFADIERLRIIDNPDQRIAQDVEGFTGVAGALSLILGLIGAIVTTITFSMVLLETAEPIRFTLFDHAIAIPGSTVWYALLYSFVGTVVIGRISRPYIRALMRQQHYEADFRANLLHVRRNASQIGLAGAVSTEQQALNQTFDQVRRNYRSVIKSTLGIYVGQGVYDRIGGILPIIVMVPRYFSGAISFGQVMGARDAFANVTGSLSYFIQMIARIGAQVANANRLKALDDAIDMVRPHGIGFSAGTDSGQALATTGLTIHRPNGASLLHIGDWTVREGERWVVEGPSGSGKSTLLGAIAGLWPDGGGSVAIADDGVVMFVPQRLYLPLGTLKHAVCFPDPPEAHDDATIKALLNRVRLDELAGNLHAIRIWQEELSPGEQQRIALARVLLHRPTLLVLDEATSALDPDNARHFYEQLQADLPDLILIGVVHDDRLRHYHTHCLTIADGHAEPGRLAKESL